MKKMISGEGKKKAKKKKYKKRRQTSSLKKMKQTKLHFGGTCVVSEVGSAKDFRMGHPDRLCLSSGIYVGVLFRTACQQCRRFDASGAA